MNRRWLKFLILMGEMYLKNVFKRRKKMVTKNRKLERRNFFVPVKRNVGWWTLEETSRRIKRDDRLTTSGLLKVWRCRIKVEAFERRFEAKITFIMDVSRLHLIMKRLLKRRMSREIRWKFLPRLRNFPLCRFARNDDDDRVFNSFDKPSVDRSIDRFVVNGYRG